MYPYIAGVDRKVASAISNITSITSRFGTSGRLRCGRGTLGQRLAVSLWCCVLTIGCADLESSSNTADRSPPNAITEESMDCPEGTGRFCSTAYVPDDSEACSDEYGPPSESGCYNEFNPPTPSILRPLSTFGTSPLQASGNEMGDHHRRFPAHDTRGCQANGSGACTQHLPHVRTTEDMNLGLHAYWETEEPSLMLFRPENLGAEMTTRRSGTRLPAPNSPTDQPADHEGYESTRVQTTLQRMMFFNPFQSSLRRHLGRRVGDEPNYYPAFPRVHQSTLCDPTSMTYSGAARNPYACSAYYSDPTKRRSGSCYDITFFAFAEDHRTAHFEQISADFTVFVANARGSRRGNQNSVPEVGALSGSSDQSGTGIYVYPRRPRQSQMVNVQGVGPVLQLPAFQPFWASAEAGWHAVYNVFAANPVPAATDINVAGPQFEALWDAAMTRPTGCYESLNGQLVARPLASAPAYCEYYVGNHHSNNTYWDMDRDAVVDPPTPEGMFMWNGAAGGHNIPFTEPVPANAGCENGNCTFRAYPQFMQVIEPTITGDGRMMVINGLYYSVNRLGACRADGFDVWRPMSTMPLDPDANATYPIAQNGLFRDSTGREVVPGEWFHGAYPWIDRRGANLIYTVAPNTRMTYRAAEYIGDLWATTDDGNPRPGWGMHDPNFRANGTGAMTLGAWTHGRVVVMDGQANMTDFGGRNNTRFRMELYREDVPDGNAVSIWTVPKGGQLFNSPENVLNHFAAMAQPVPFDVAWTVAGDHQMNFTVMFDEYMNPNAAVVAHMNAPIALSGNLAITQRDGFVAVHPGVPDGNVFGLSTREADGETVQRPIHQFAEVPELQNASGYHNWQLRLLGGARVESVALGGPYGRGVYLDGNNDAISVSDRTAVPGASDQYLYAAWFDRRTDEIDPYVRTLFTFPDGSWIGIRAVLQDPRDPSNQQSTRGPFPYVFVAYNAVTRQVKYLAAQATGSEQDADSPFRRGRYTHIGVQTLNGGPGVRRLVFYVNGNRIGTLEFRSRVPYEDSQDPPNMAGPGFKLHGPNGNTPFFLGDNGLDDSSLLEHRPFQGWVDEFRIYGLTSNELSGDWFQESICNLAFGTLVDVDAVPNAALEDELTRRQAHYFGQALRAPAFCEQMRLESYTTMTDFPRQRVSEGGSPITTACIGQVHLPAGAADWCLRYERLDLPILSGDVQRPDSTENPFCLSCHHDNHEIAGLDLGALTPGFTTCGQFPFQTICPLPFWQDSRRQPLQPPAALSGSYGETGVPSNTPYAVFYNHLYQSTPTISGGAHPVDVSLSQSNIGGRVQPWW